MIDIADLCARAARLCDVPAGAIRDRRGRSQRLTDARQAIAYVLYSRQYTVVEIGDLLRRDHSTICYSLKQARRRVRDESHFRELVEELQIVPAVPLEPPPPTAPSARTIAITPPLRLAMTLYGVMLVKAA